jgi:hypothetical protein
MRLWPSHCHDRIGYHIEDRYKFRFVYYDLYAQESQVVNSVLFNKKAQDWALVGVALVLYDSPRLVGFADTSAMWCVRSIAIPIMCLGIAAAESEGERWEERLIAALGLAVVILPWPLGLDWGSSTTRVLWLLGTLTFVIAVWAQWLDPINSPDK